MWLHRTLKARGQSVRPHCSIVAVLVETSTWCELTFSHLKDSRGEKSARIIALAHAIQEGYFDPDTVNMSEVATALDLNRSTIMRDLRIVEGVMGEAKEIQAKLGNLPTTTNTRRHKRRNE